MELDRDACYRALLARDARHDGRFYTCVTTTGVYCRPVCPARAPKSVHCVFVPSAAAAQEQGFRPCLRCRPERAPALFRTDSPTVSRALQLIDQGALDRGDMDEFAARLGLGARHLRRLFHAHVGAAPITVAQTRRILLAKTLLHETGLGMAQVAEASGFSSLRRFNEAFQAMYARPPSELRRARSRSDTALVLSLPYRQPYDFARMLAFLGARAIREVECVTDDAYLRSFSLDGAVGTLRVSDAKKESALEVQVKLSRLSVLPALIARVRALFDLASDPHAIQSALSRSDVLAPLVGARPGLRVPGAWDGFEVAVRAILGQQITVRAATDLGGRLASTLGAPLPAELVRPGLSRSFPAPERFELSIVRGLGMPQKRAQALCDLAQAYAANGQLFEPADSLDASIARLTALPGIGAWTAHYIAMRAMRESDAFPVGDIGLLRAMAIDGVRPTPRALTAQAEAFRPFRAYAALHLWTEDAERTAHAAHA